MSAEPVLRLDWVPLARWTAFRRGHGEPADIEHDPVVSRWRRAAATVPGASWHERSRGTKAIASRFAPTTVPILLLAETGTGKEPMARAIHDASHEGKLAAARHGTLFLDEIGETTPALQAEAVSASAGNLSEAARLLGVSRNTLYRMMRHPPT